MYKAPDKASNRIQNTKYNKMIKINNSLIKIDRISSIILNKMRKFHLRVRIIHLYTSLIKLIQLYNNHSKSFLHNNSKLVVLNITGRLLPINFPFDNISTSICGQIFFYTIFTKLKFKTLHM